MRSRATWLVVAAVGAVVFVGVVDAVRRSGSHQESAPAGQVTLTIAGSVMTETVRAPSAPPTREPAVTTQPVTATAALANQSARPSTCPRVRPNNSGSPSGSRTAWRHSCFVACKGSRATTAGRPSSSQLGISLVTPLLSSGEIRAQLGQPISQTDSSSSSRSPKCPATRKHPSWWSQQSAPTWFDAPCPARSFPATTASDQITLRAVGARLLGRRKAYSKGSHTRS
jgi:hypothetical protein